MSLEELSKSVCTNIVVELQVYKRNENLNKILQYVNVTDRAMDIYEACSKEF